jgi:peptidoglycan/LPS O-acetylase OafA/YrhL
VFVLRGLKFSATDEFLGNLSYGVFLNHFLLIWLAQSYLQASSPLWVACIIGVSMALALATYWLVEQRALEWRRAIRYGRSRRIDTAEALSHGLSAAARNTVAPEIRPAE